MSEKVDGKETMSISISSQHDRRINTYGVIHQAQPRSHLGMRRDWANMTETAEAGSTPQTRLKKNTMEASSSFGFCSDPRLRFSAVGSSLRCGRGR